MNRPNSGAVADLADIAAQVVNSAVAAGTDSTGQDMIKLRAALIARLQRALAEVYPDERDHNSIVANALCRSFAQ